uniref:Tubulin--tyrosine ligase-like protein 9 n=1 Tax=Alexandrium monilatum TaxID=311494 RepID=A0A7S4Q4U4_9DINO
MKPHLHLGAKAALANIIGPSSMDRIDRNVDSILASASAAVLERAMDAHSGLENATHRSIRGNHYWELMRFDCFVDESLSVSVVEINMSPNQWPHNPGKGEVPYDDTSWRHKLQDDVLLEVAAWASTGFLREDAERRGGDVATGFREVWRGEKSLPEPAHLRGPNRSLPHRRRYFP